MLISGRAVKRLKGEERKAVGVIGARRSRKAVRGGCELEVVNDSGRTRMERDPVKPVVTSPPEAERRDKTRLKRAEEHRPRNPSAKANYVRKHVAGILHKSL